MNVSLVHRDRPLGTSKPIGIMKLTEHTCRWPLTSEAPWTYCGLHRERGAYCATHAALAYQDETQRKPRP